MTGLIGVESMNDTVEFGLKVTERRVTYINKRTSPCKPYDKAGRSFSRCVKDFIGGYIEAVMKCFLPGLSRNFWPHSNTFMSS